MSSPSITPAVKVLVSRIALRMGALNGHEIMRLGDSASIAETVPSLDSGDPRNQPIDCLAVARMTCAIIV